MPVSEPRPGLRTIARAAAIVFVLVAILWSTAYVAATRRTSLALYYRQFDNSVAHTFAARLRKAPGAVLVLGASSTHDGFDEDIMKRHGGGWSFVNGGTGMGSIFVYEALTQMLRDYRVAPGVLVIGLHPVALSDRHINFNGGGYTDFFDYWHGWDLVGYDHPLYRDANRREALLNTVWPGHRFSRQISRLARLGIFEAHKRMYWGPQLPREAFERAPEDLVRRPKYFYSDPAPLPGAALTGVKWFEETTAEWAAPRHLDSLRRTLEQALAASPKVVVLLMPEHSLLREQVSAKLRSPLLAALDEYRSRGVVVIDSSDAVADDRFRDSIHLLASGREQLSTALAAEIAGRFPANR